MVSDQLVEVDGGRLTNCLAPIVQAWAKQEGGDLAGAAEVLATAMTLVPSGTVELILSMIDVGELPVPSPDTMTKWMEICEGARSGEFTVSYPGPGVPGA